MMTKRMKGKNCWFFSIDERMLYVAYSTRNAGDIWFDLLFGSEQITFNFISLLIQNYVSCLNFIFSSRIILLIISVWLLSACPHAPVERNILFASN